MKWKLEAEKYKWVLFMPKAEHFGEETRPILFIQKETTIPLNILMTFSWAEVSKVDDKGVWIQLGYPQ